MAIKKGWIFSAFCTVDRKLGIVGCAIKINEVAYVSLFCICHFYSPMWLQISKGNRKPGRDLHPEYFYKYILNHH